MHTTIRLATNRDAAAIAAIYAPSCESSTTSFEYVAPTAEEMAGRIRAITARFPWLVLDQHGVVAGYAYAGQHSERAAYGWSVNAAVYVGAGYRRCGVGRALYTALFYLLRLQGYFKVYAGVTLPNPASIGLHEAVGFRPVGVYRGVGYKHGAWHDVAWYQFVLQPERTSPGVPVPISGLSDGSGWQDAVSRGLQHFQAHRVRQATP